MKRIASFLSVALLSVTVIPAHAVSNPDFTVNKINNTFRAGKPIATSNGLSGGGPGGGSGIPVICNASPENATILLALLSGAGLLAGSRIRRVRLMRTTSC